MSTVPTELVTKIETLHDILQDAAILNQSRFAEPMISLMFTSKKDIILTIYSPTVPLNGDKRNHEYAFSSIEDVPAKVDELISIAKSVAYTKVQSDQKNS